MTGWEYLIQRNLWKKSIRKKINHALWILVSLPHPFFLLSSSYCLVFSLPFLSPSHMFTCVFGSCHFSFWPHLASIRQKTKWVLPFQRQTLPFLSLSHWGSAGRCKHTQPKVINTLTHACISISLQFRQGFRNDRPVWCGLGWRWSVAAGCWLVLSSGCSEASPSPSQRWSYGHHSAPPLSPGSDTLALWSLQKQRNTGHCMLKYLTVMQHKCLFLKGAKRQIKHDFLNCWLPLSPKAHQQLCLWLCHYWISECVSSRHAVTFNVAFHNLLLFVNASTHLLYLRKL